MYCVRCNNDTNLLKAFDCLSVHLLIAKMHVYGIDLLSLKLLQDYLSNLRQRTKIDLKISYGEPQGSILGAILFNIFIDQFLFLHEAQFTSYADDGTPFMVRGNISADMISALEEIGKKLLIWFSVNQMKLNIDKCHLLPNTQDQNFLKIGNFNIKLVPFLKSYWLLLFIVN